jgi:CheY-like chemotaxis protein
MIDLALTHRGYDVKIAHNGSEGIGLLHNDSRFNLVITDIRMPVADGNQVAKHIRNNEKTHKTPIIAVSAYPSDAEKGLFDSILAKPFKIKELIELITSFA